jgi:molecular chaperone HscB
MLKEKGYQVNEGDSISDPELLMEVMEFREELEEVGSQKELEPLKERNDGKKNTRETCLDLLIYTFF